MENLYLTKLVHFSNSAVNPLVYGFRIPEYKVIFFRLLRINYIIPKRDSIELDSLAIKNSPGSFGDVVNDGVSRNAASLTSVPAENTCVRRSSIPSFPAEDICVRRCNIQSLPAEDTCVMQSSISLLPAEDICVRRSSIPSLPVEIFVQLSSHNHNPVSK